MPARGLNGERKNMKKLTTIKLVALLLVFVMLLSVVSCFDDDTPTTTKPSTSTTTTTGKPDGPDDPPAHVCVFGEWEVIKEATNTEDGLRQRRCECGEVEQEVIEASGKEYYIQYRNLKTAEYPKENGYNSKEGLLNLPIPEAEGYVFIGWYTASIGGELVDYIPEGSKQNYILFAHWELISYEITYKNAPNNTNVTSYDIEDKLKLETPKWSGLVFTHWSDEEGNLYKPSENITALPERMHGDLVLTANWKVLRNIATPAGEDAELYSAYISSQNTIYFVFRLGTIEHVVLDDIYPDMYYKYEGMPINLSLSKTVSISEEKGESISNTISQSISNTSSFSSASEWVTENSLTQSADISISAKAGNEKIFSVGVETTIGAESTDSSSYGHSNSRNYTSGSTSSSSKSIASSLTFKKEITSEITENISIDADLPSGYYAYVHAGNINVYGVVSYDVASGNYYIDTYSRLENMHSMIMYYADVNQLNNPSIEGLDFNIPEEKILSYVEKWKSTAWVEKESGSFLFADFPSGFDTNNSIYKSMEKEAYTEFETETTKRVVTIEKVGYVYWHWMYDTSAGAGDRIIYYKKGTYSLNGYGYYDFGAFLSSEDYRRTTSNRNQPTPDYYWYTDTGRTSNADSQGSKYWYRFEYYRCTYTDYVKGSVE